MLLKSMKTYTSEGRDRSAMERGEGERGTHTYTNDGGKTLTVLHSSNNSFIPNCQIGFSYCEKRNVLRELRKEEIEFVSLMFPGKAFHRMAAI